MSDIPDPVAFETAFHHAAERHERVWIFMTLVLLTLLLVGSMFFVVFDYGVVVRTAGFHANPAAPAATRTGIVRTGPDRFDVHMLARLWSWAPSPVHLPQGATVTFYVTSADVLHGFEVQGTTINVTAIPGVTGSATYTFRHAGTYNIVCNEFCGIEHQAMIGRIVVDPARQP